MPISQPAAHQQGDDARLLVVRDHGGGIGNAERDAFATLAVLDQTAIDFDARQALSVACDQPFCAPATRPAVFDRSAGIGRRRLPRRRISARTASSSRRATSRGQSTNRTPAAGRPAKSRRAAACCRAASAGPAPRRGRASRHSRCPVILTIRARPVGDHTECRMGAMAARRLENQIADGIAGALPRCRRAGRSRPSPSATAMRSFWAGRAAERLRCGQHAAIRREQPKHLRDVIDRIHSRISAFHFFEAIGALYGTHEFVNGAERASQSPRTGASRSRNRTID